MLTQPVAIKIIMSVAGIKWTGSYSHFGKSQNVPRIEDKRSIPCQLGDDNQAPKVGGGSPLRASVCFVGLSGEQEILSRKYSQSYLNEVFSRVRVREVKRKLNLQARLVKFFFATL
ncbi:hypothetical protein GQR36_23785 [Enterococcus termitis]|uniref:Uncharacterized protein n=1 Tax=Enterococcus termitis TaxID=332950 RepID=A0A1E5H577_9ENTE|nr:hypothetical protein BCR25_14495 [Enterococcus termitis]